MSKRTAWRISRRTLLRGAGAAVALPWLDAMAPAAHSQAADPPPSPVRLLFYITGGGAYVPYWSLDDHGRREELARDKSVVYQAPPSERNEPLTVLSPTLEPLAPHRSEVLVLGGLTLANAHGFEDGHSAEIAALLTGASLARDRIHCGVSVDQFAAQRLAGATWLDSLVLGLNGARPGGAKGIGRVYAQHYSWRTPTTPTGEERNPRLVFERLFRGGDSRAERGAASADRRSVLDLVREEAQRLRLRVGAADRRKLDEYLHAVRDVERRIDYAARRPLDPQAPSLLGDQLPLDARIPTGTGIPESYVEYDRLMIDLIALAFQADLTRVAVLTHGGYRSYPEVDVRRGHHDCQHHEGAPEKRADLRKIDRFNVGLFADALDRFRSTPDGDGSLLDRSLVMFGSGMSNGNRHSPENLPVILAGRGGGTVAPGRYVDYNWKRRTPIANLYVELLRRVGVDTAKFGDSTGGLPHLA